MKDMHYRCKELFISVISRDAHRDLFKRHRTSDLNRIMRAPIITR